MRRVIQTKQSRGEIGGDGELRFFQARDLKVSMRTITCLLFLFSLLTANAEDRTAAKLDALNQEFRRQYGVARAENLAAMPLVIVMATNQVTWVANGKTHVIPTPLVAYNEVKALTHAIIGAYGLGSCLIRNGISPAEREETRKLVANIDQAIALTRKTSLSPEEQAMLDRVLLNLRTLVAGWITAPSLTQKQLETGLRALRKDTLILVNKRAVVQYRNIAAAFQSIKRSVPPEVWSEALVIGENRPVARRDNLELAPAVKEFGRGALGKRIFFAENVFDAPTAIQVLAGLQIDRELSATFLDDPFRMWRDFLGDVSRKETGGTFYPGLAQ